MWIVERLFLDSLLFLRVLPGGIGHVADLGSGAGIPGIPLKIVRPDLVMTLIESRARRVSFLRTVIRELELERIEVVAARVAPGHAGLAGRFDAVIARCAGGLQGVIETGRALLRPGGWLVVAGPPRAAALPPGARWVEVPGTKPGVRRRFVVLERPGEECSA